jgi:LysM repeat protein
MDKFSFYIIVFLLCMASQRLSSQENNPPVSVAGRQTENIFYHTVERGQTIYAISVMYDVGEEDIYRLNPASRQYIRVGEKLKIPQRETSVASDREMEDMYVFHTIQQGETLYGVSKRYNVSGEQIAKANPGLTTRTFASGKTIRIPATKMQPLPTIEKVTVTKEIEYTIKKKETMYSLCKKFKTTSDKLIRHNPELKSGLKAGMVIKIPLETEEEITIMPEQNEMDINSLIAYWNDIQKVDVIRIALLLPFQTGDAKTSARFVEYYEGFLMAVDSMRNAGLSIELSVYDIGDNVQKTATALQSETLLKANLLIGGVTNEQIERIADFALKNEIKYVVPFSSKCDKLTSSNAYIFQINTPYQYLYSYVTSRVCALYSNYNIIILDTKDKDDKTQFIHALKADMTDRNIPFRQLVHSSANSLLSDLTGLLTTDKPNLLIPVSSSAEAIAKIKSALRVLAESATNTYQLTLFGYPEWQTYMNECVEDFFMFNAGIYTSFYANNLSGEVQRFSARYSYLYKKNMASLYPKYAMLGFDTGMFFISAINKYGAHFETNIQQHKYNSLQTGFHFERVNNWGGFINTNLYIVRFNKDFTITRAE